MTKCQVNNGRVYPQLIIQVLYSILKQLLHYTLSLEGSNLPIPSQLALSRVFHDQSQC